MTRFQFWLKGAGIALHMIFTGMAILMDIMFAVMHDPLLKPLLVMLHLLGLVVNYLFYRKWRTAE